MLRALAASLKSRTQKVTEALHSSIFDDEEFMEDLADVKEESIL